VGGDEFLVALLGERANDADAAANRILDRFKLPFKVDTAHSMCGASVGFATAQPGSTLEELLRDADLALYEAKRLGRGQIVPFTTEMSENYQNRTALEYDLEYALENEELDVVYQPIVDPRSGRTICCEALLRWNHPVLGEIKPDVFIPIAEAKGLIGPIGAWVLMTACVEATNWDPEIRLAVNLSPVQFRRSREILDVATSALMESGLACKRLDLEITESVLINDNEATRKVLADLRGLEIGISLDDFGTGFASIAYLNDFPISKIKIDKRFSQNVCGSSRTSAIVRGIAQIARELRMECIAEGVETLEQLERLQSFGINAIQGYLLSKPLPAYQLREIIKGKIQPISVRRTNGLTHARRKVAS
jgi:predicted signal transduction protein with EAL and GGDEF domain